MSENSTKAAHAVLAWMGDEGIIDFEDDVMEPERMEAYIADIIAVSYGEVVGVPTVTLDELEEEDFFNDHERIIDEW